jgi:hypothetical protein
VADKLSAILQKPEQEMKMMLKRTFYQNKKKAQKLEIDKLQAVFVKTIELCLKETNTTDNLTSLRPNFSLKFTKENREAFATVAAHVKEYVKVCNEY